MEPGKAILKKMLVSEEENKGEEKIHLTIDANVHVSVN